MRDYLWRVETSILHSRSFSRDSFHWFFLLFDSYSQEFWGDCSASLNTVSFSKTPLWMVNYQTYYLLKHYELLSHFWKTFLDTLKPAVFKRSLFCFSIFLLFFLWALIFYIHHTLGGIHLNPAQFALSVSNKWCWIS